MMMMMMMIMTYGRIDGWSPLVSFSRVEGTTLSFVLVTIVLFALLLPYGWYMKTCSQDGFPLLTRWASTLGLDRHNEDFHKQAVSSALSQPLICACPFYCFLICSGIVYC
jgi:hypothetical protein